MTPDAPARASDAPSGLERGSAEAPDASPAPQRQPVRQREANPEFDHALRLQMAVITGE